MNTEIFIKIDSDIFFDRSIPPICRDIHSLAIDLLKIPGWIIRKKYIADKLGISLRTVDRYFNLLVKKGLAFYDAMKHRWHLFKSPIVSNNASCSDRGLPQMVEAGLPLLAPINNNNNYPEEKTTTQPTEIIIMPDTVTPVVVSFEEEKLKFPDNFTKDQKADAKHILKKLNKPELAEIIMLALADVLTKKTLKKTIPHYLGWAVSFANENGTFTHLEADGNAKVVNPGIDQTEKIKKYNQGINKSAPEIGRRKIADIKKCLFGGYQSA